MQLKLGRVWCALFIGALLALNITSVTSRAEAAPLPVVEPQLNIIKGGLEISFTTPEGQVKADQVEVMKDRKRNRFKVKLSGYRCERRFMTRWEKRGKARGFKRALLYPSKQRSGTCYLLVRMRRRVTRAQLTALKAVETRDQASVITFYRKPSARPKTPKATPSPQPETSQQVSAAPESEGQAESQAQPQAQASTTAPSPAPNPAPSATPEPNDGLIAPPERPTEQIKAPQDVLSARDKPDEVIETAVLGQINKARMISAAPVILSTPMVILKPEEMMTSSARLKLELSSRLLTALIDQEALNRGGSVWIADEKLRRQIERLNPHSVAPDILARQERAVAAHIGATLVSRTQLSVSGDEFTLTTSMTPVGRAQAENPEPGVYKVQHRLSRPIVEAALDQAWVVEERSASAWRSFVLPGWGHLYRGERRQGLTYLSLGLGLAASAIISGGFGYFAALDYSENDPRTAHRRDDANAHYDRANLLWIGAALVHITSIVDNLSTARDRAYLDVSRVDWNLARDTAESGGDE